MKILVMSLLRIGDVIMSASALRDLRARYPDAEIHLLVNSQFAGVGRLMPYIDRVIRFDREKIQKGLGDASVPVFESYERLSDLIDDLNSQKYDWSINLTHNRLSGWLMSLIESKTKTGLCFDAQGRANFGSIWFHYLNRQVDAEGTETFHFSDIFRFALGLDPGEDSSECLVETEAGRSEAEEFLHSLSSRKVVAVQPLTSDTKKNWSLASFASAIEAMSRRHPETSFAILGAPFEREALTPLLASLEAKNIKCHLAILSFEGAFSLLKRADLLLTGDTSIKHLAAAAGIRIVEVSLGSSDPFRTGAYRQGSVIVRSREACAPCPHSKACHRTSHACAERVSPEAVAMIASEVYSRQAFQLRAIAEEYIEQIEVLRVEKKVSGFWAAYSVLEPFTEETVARWIDLSCRKMWLMSVVDRRSDYLAEQGTEVLRLSRLLKTIHPQVSAIEWRHLLADCERQAQLVEGRINGLKVGIQYLKSCYEDPKKMRDFVRGLISLRERIRHSPLLRSFKGGLDLVIEDDISPSFTRFRHMIDLVSEIERRTDIHLRLIRGLTSVIDPASGHKEMEKL